MEYKEGKDSLRVESPYHLSCFSGFPFFLFLSHSWVISIRSFDICGFVQLCLFVSLSLLFWGLNFSISGADFLMLVILLKFFCSCLQVFAGWTGWIQAYIWLNRQLLLWSIFSFFNLFFPLQWQGMLSIGEKNWVWWHGCRMHDSRKMCNHCMKHYST